MLNRMGLRWTWFLAKFVHIFLWRIKFVQCGQHETSGFKSFFPVHEDAYDAQSIWWAKIVGFSVKYIVQQVCWPSQRKNCWHKKLQNWNAMCFSIFLPVQILSAAYRYLRKFRTSDLVKVEVFKPHIVGIVQNITWVKFDFILCINSIMSIVFDMKRWEVWAMSFLRTPTLQRNGSDMASRSQRNVYLSKLGGLSLDVLEEESLCLSVWLKMIKMKLQNHNLSEVPFTQNFVKEWFRRDEIARIWVAGEKEWQLSSVDFYLVSQALFW